MKIRTLEEEWSGLTVRSFSEEDALRLGQALVAAAAERKAPVVIDIRTPNRTLFHAAMPGSGPTNDLWALRKSNLALDFQVPSMLTALRFRASKSEVAHHGLSDATHALSGGSVPIRVAQVGVVAAATVSGLPETEDHAMVVAAIRATLP